MKKTVVRTYQYRSKQNASLIYTVLLYQNGEASCNCRAFTGHENADGTRSCEHIRAAGLGKSNAETPLVLLAKAKQSFKHGAPAPVSKGINRRMVFED
jgi:hypothetical protein